MTHSNSFLTWLATSLASAFVFAACDHGAVAADGMDATDAADTSEGGLPPDAYIAPRMPGQRAPRSASCDDTDTLRCALPWPSNVFTVLDSTTPTGLRLHVSSMAVAMGDAPDALNRADGFSRVSPLATGFRAEIDPMSLGDGTTASVRLLVAQPGATFGQAVPLRMKAIVDPSPQRPESLVIAYPREPLAPASDYVAVVTDDLHVSSGSALTPDRDALVSLGLAAPATLDELALAAYHAPTRMLLASAGIDPHHVLRVWDFTTRSLDEPTLALRTMRQGELDAVSHGAITVTIDFAMVPTSGTVAVIIEGHVHGLPNYVGMDQSLARDATGTPMVVGAHDAPFRIAIPQGTGDYRIIMFGHGLGGSYEDNTFDDVITMNGAAKVGTNFVGFTSSDVANTFGSFSQAILATDHATAELVQSLADGMAIQASLEGVIGDAVSATMVGGMTNPAAGRRPRLDMPIWAGGSLGGTMGLIYANADPTIRAGVLNVPGAAWTHFMADSSLFALITALVREQYPTDVDLQLGVAMTQTVWDEADGASFARLDPTRDLPLLLQESMGDPVLPNPGNEMVAVSVNAAQVGMPLQPILHLDQLMEADDRSGLTQYRVPSSVTGTYAIHGFAAGSSIAGVAAREQIFDFVGSVWAGTPRITLPTECQMNTPANSCDFSAH